MVLKQTYLTEHLLLEFVLQVLRELIPHSHIHLQTVNQKAYLPLLMDQYFRNDNDFKYEHCVLRHTCITGSSSYLYWEKSSGNTPVLLMLTAQLPDWT